MLISRRHQMWLPQMCETFVHWREIQIWINETLYTVITRELLGIPSTMPKRSLEIPAWPVAERLSTLTITHGRWLANRCYIRDIIWKTSFRSEPTATTFLHRTNHYWEDTKKTIGPNMGGSGGPKLFLFLRYIWWSRLKSSPMINT